MKVHLDHTSTECEDKAKGLASHGFAYEPGYQVTAGHINAAIEHLVVIRVNWQYGSL